MDSIGTRRFRQGLFRASLQTFTVTRSSQRRKCSGPPKGFSSVYSRRNTSCTASSASWGVAEPVQGYAVYHVLMLGHSIYKGLSFHAGLLF